MEEAEFLYNHVGEIFNLMNTSVVSRTRRIFVNLHRILDILLQYFRREEQNFVTANEIDTMALIMPSGSTR